MPESTSQQSLPCCTACYIDRMQMSSTITLQLSWSRKPPIIDALIKNCPSFSMLCKAGFEKIHLRFCPTEQCCFPRCKWHPVLLVDHHSAAKKLQSQRECGQMQ